MARDLSEASVAGGERTPNRCVIYIKIYLSEPDMSAFLNISIATLKSALSSTNYCTSCCC